jgi:phosphatidylserine/phosphatidylglycerophosphate/cardiolipin synthase-like enzyme
MWIFDDTFAIIGSANCNRRSYSTDSEVGVAILDRAAFTTSSLAKALRMSLWLKHLNATPFGTTASKSYGASDVDDFVAAAPLWDRAPLLQKEDFTTSPLPDLPITKLFGSLSFLGKSVPSAALSAIGKTRDDQWALIDPDGT